MASQTSPMKPVTLASLSSITHRLALTEHGGHRLLVAAFAGEYRPGSSGSPDARLMTAVIAGALVAWPVDGVVLDLRELSYEWGDGMLSVFHPPERTSVPLSWAVVASPRSSPALHSLLGGDDILFDDLDAAVAFAATAATEAEARDAALETACLVVRVADDVPPGEVADRAAAVAVRAGLAVDDDGDMRCWSGGLLRTRVETAPREMLRPARGRMVGFTPDAVAWLEEG